MVISRNLEFRLFRFLNRSLCFEEKNTFVVIKEYLTIIPRAQMASESIAHEAEG